MRVQHIPTLSTVPRLITTDDCDLEVHPRSLTARTMDVFLEGDDVIPILYLYREDSVHEIRFGRIAFDRFMKLSGGIRSFVEMVQVWFEKAEAGEDCDSVHVIVSSKDIWFIATVKAADLALFVTVDQPNDHDGEVGESDGVESDIYAYF